MYKISINEVHNLFFGDENKAKKRIIKSDTERKAYDDKLHTLSIQGIEWGDFKFGRKYYDDYDD